MNLRSLHLYDLMQCITNVEQTMGEQKGIDRLLDAARADTPIIDEMLQAIAMINAEKNSARKRRGFEVAQRNLVLFLALREIERASIRRKAVKKKA